MEVEIKQSTAVTLRLTEEEARWLKSMVQNPLGENEDTRDRQMREAFWLALASVHVY